MFFSEFARLILCLVAFVIMFMNANDCFDANDLNNGLGWMLLMIMTYMWTKASHKARMLEAMLKSIADAVSAEQGGDGTTPANPE